MTLPDPWAWTGPGRRSAQRDPLHELELHRALLAQARLQKPLNLSLVHGLEKEVAWWLARAERKMATEAGTWPAIA